MNDISRLILDFAIILLTTKVLGLVARKLGLPQVVGFVVAGLLIGPAILGYIPGFNGFVPYEAGTPAAIALDVFAEIGVLLILFSAGLETDTNELKKIGGISTLIACAGVFVPLILGFLVGVMFTGGFNASFNNFDLLFSNIFIGIILTATSVGITVEVLRELGKLKSKTGKVIVSAAVIDDVIGILVLAVFMSVRNTEVKLWVTLLLIFLFFVFALVVGVLLHKFFKWYDNKFGGKRRIAIFAVVVCFVFAVLAEDVFHIAAITGAYLAGIVMSGLKDTDYIDRKVDILGYMLFYPVFFACVGIKTSFVGFNLNIFLFCIVLVIVGILGKIGGCGLVARTFKYNFKESTQVGVGMVARGELALVMCSIAIANNYFSESPLDPAISTIFLIICSSLTAPILLRLLFKDKIEINLNEQTYIVGSTNCEDKTEVENKCDETYISNEVIKEHN